MAWTLHLGQAGIQGGPQQGLGVLGSQFQPGSQPGSVGVRGFLDELDAQVSAARKADQQHRFSHARLSNRGDLAAEHGSKTPDQLLPAMWAGEEVDVVTQRCHNLGPFGLCLDGTWVALLPREGA
jgi:hypothetical protein